MGIGSKIVTPRKSAQLSPEIFGAVVLIASALGIAAIIFFFNPGTYRFYPVCLFHVMTGLNCPGCGMTRALYALLHGNILLALKDNALFLVTLLALILYSMHFVSQRLKNKPVIVNVSPKFLWLFLAVAVVFGIVRNLPGCEWLSP